ncbi:hypothetical protein Tco_0782428 [Tanacetum coccineum]
MEGKKPKDLKNKSFDSIQKMFNKAFKRVNTFIDFRTDLVEGSSKRAGTKLEQELNTAYPLPLDTAYPVLCPIQCIQSNRLIRLHDKEFYERTITPYKEPEREFRSSRRHFKTLSLDQLRSPDFNLLSDEEYLEEEEEEAMAETMEQYMSKTRTDYGSGVARPKIDNKDQFELKGQFLKEIRENTFSGSDNEDANEHIECMFIIKGGSSPTSMEAFVRYVEGSSFAGGICEIYCKICAGFELRWRHL